MAWWAPTVLGGDEPLDLVDNLEALLGIRAPNRWFDGSASTRRAIKRYGEANYLYFIEHSPPYSPLVAAHVVALFHLAAGVAMEPTVKALALQACRYGHMWFQRSDERRQHLTELACLIEDFDVHRPKPLPYERLVKLLGL